MKKLLLILILVLTGAGCKKYIDEPDHSTLTTDMLFNSSRDLENLLYGAYGAIANGATLAGNWRVFSELMADHVVVNVSEASADDPYQQLYDRKMGQAVYAENWKQAYIALQNVNTVLYAIDNRLITQEKDPEFNELTRNRIRGEAYFIRGLVHFELVRFYGHQYGYQSAAAGSGIVLKTAPTLNVRDGSGFAAVKRATVEEVYELVIADLEVAQTLMPATPLRRGKATSYAAAAYLARVYFQMGDYENALLQINKVIGVTPGVIETEFKLVRSPATGNITAKQAASNVTAPFTSSATSAKVSENIFDLVSVSAAPVNGVISRRYLRTAAIEPQLAISNAFLTEAAFDSKDARKVALISTVGDKAYAKKYDQTNMNIPVIRSAELLLDRAEILALQGNTAGAAKDIHLLRDRAIPGYDTAKVIPADQVLQEVRRERIRELAFEGDRLHNLRRLNADVGPGDRQGVSPLSWSSNKLLFRIPDAEIKASNGSVVQNPEE